MGDGTAALILDVLGLLQNANLAEHDAAGTDALAAEATRTEDTTQAMLLVRHGGDRFALPLVDVPRLEKIPRSAVEREEDRPVVQYRGGVLPLKDMLGASQHEVWWTADEPSRENGSLNVIVYADRDRPVGLVVDEVDEVEDVVQEELTLVVGTSRWPEAIGTAIVLGEVAAVLDIDAVTKL